MFETPRAVACRGGTLKLYPVDGAPSGVSPSGAGAAIVGRAENGKQTWEVEGDGCHYAARRASLIGEEVAV